MSSREEQRLQEQLMNRLDPGRDLSDNEVHETIDSLLVEESRTTYIPLAKRRELHEMLFNSVRRLDLLQELLEDDAVTEIMVNGMEGIFYEKEGYLQRWDRTFSSREKLQDIVQQIVSACNRKANESEAIVDARLAGGARVNIVMAPIAIDGPVITIRRFPDHPIRMEQLIAWNSISAEAADFLKQLVRAGYNIFISGGTGSGKTTFLNALSDFIPKDERIITIEDNAELQLQGIDNLVRLESRRKDNSGKHEITIRDLIRTSLRMRPNRIIVGEVRGPEIVDLISGALNTGHDGSLSTGHGNNPRDMLTRLETMYAMGMEIPLSAIRRQIASGIDIMVHLGRLRDKSRKVLEILEIDGYRYDTGEILTHPLFEFQETGEKNGLVDGKLVPVGSLKNRTKLKMAGVSLAEEEEESAH